MVEFDDAEVRPQVAAGLRDLQHQEVADLLGELGQLRVRSGHRGRADHGCSRADSLIHPTRYPSLRAMCAAATQHAAARRTQYSDQATAARTAGCRRCGSSRLHRACRCAGPASNSMSFLPDGDCSLGFATTCSVFGVRPSFSSSTPEMSTISVPSSPERIRGLARPGTAAGARPSRSGWSGGCARSSRVMTALTPSRLVPFAAQSRDDPEPYSLPPKMTSGIPAAW